MAVHTASPARPQQGEYPTRIGEAKEAHPLGRHAMGCSKQAGGCSKHAFSMLASPYLTQLDW